MCGQGNKDSECHIYGAYMDATMERLNNPSIGFYMKGRVDDVFSTLAAYGVLLAPLRFGAGSKGKNIGCYLNGITYRNYSYR